MAEQARQVKTRRKVKPTTDSSQRQAVALHVRQRPCDIDQPETAYVGDLTYIWPAEGWLSRAVVGWARHRWLKAELVTQALQMALDQRQPCPGGIMPTDRGSQYAAERYVPLLHHYEMVPSMRRKGHWGAKAVAESFCHTLKTAGVSLETFATRAPAQEALGDSIEVFYHRPRRHSANSHLAPVLYEQSQKAA